MLDSIWSVESHRPHSKTFRRQINIGPKFESSLGTLSFTDRYHRLPSLVPKGAKTNHLFCLTVSAVLMKSKFARRPCVRPSVAEIIAEPIEWTSLFLLNFRCWLCLAFLRTFLFLKRHFPIFLRIISVSITMGPYGSKDFRMLLFLRITAKCFQTFPEFSSQWSSQNYFGIFESLKFEILTFRVPFR